MSFAHETKTMLVEMADETKHDCCRRSGLYGIMYAAGIFSRNRCKLVTTCEELAELTVKRLRELYRIEANLYLTDRKSGDEEERKSCKITVPQKKELDKLFCGLKYSEDDCEAKIVEKVFKCPNCRSSFLRGVFLSAGTITDPEKGYHLEISLTDVLFADSLEGFLTALGFEPKRTVRKNENVLYFKDSESIENFLAYIGANSAAFTIMNKKIERELRSGANRIANGEIANLTKTVNAASDQIAAIKQLIADKRIDTLPEELRQTAYLRLENSSLTLSELAALHEPPITKSGVNHRLKKIMEQASRKDD